MSAVELVCVRHEYKLGNRELEFLVSSDGIGQLRLSLNDKDIWIGSELALEMSKLIQEHFGVVSESKSTSVSNNPRFPFVSPGAS